MRTSILLLIATFLAVPSFVFASNCKVHVNNYEWDQQMLKDSLSKVNAELVLNPEEADYFLSFTKLHTDYSPALIAGTNQINHTQIDLADKNRSIGSLIHRTKVNNNVLNYTKAQIWWLNKKQDHRFSKSIRLLFEDLGC